MLSCGPYRSRQLLSSLSQLGTSPKHVSSINLLISELRQHRYRLVIIDSYGMSIEPVGFIRRLRFLDSYLTVLYLGEMNAITQRRVERSGGALTVRAPIIRNNILLAVGKLLAHHHSLANLRVDLSTLDVESF